MGPGRFLSYVRTLASIPAVGEGRALRFTELGPETETERVFWVTQQVGEACLHPSCGIAKPVASPLQVPRSNLRIRQLSLPAMSVPG